MALRRVERTPHDLPGNGWYDILPAPPAASELDGDIDADWLIVGAGFTGLAAAQRLRQLRPGDRIVVIDAQRVGWGASGRNSGFMIDLPHQLNSESYIGGADQDSAEIAMNRVAIDYAEAMAQEFGLGAFFSRCGKYHGAATEAGARHLNAFAKHLDLLGERYAKLDASQMAAVTGTTFYRSGLHAPGAAIIQPAAFVRGIAAGLQDKVRIFENSPVLKIETGAPHTIRTAKGSVRAPRVVLAVNGHAQSFGLYPRQLMHVFTYGSMTRQLTSDEQGRLGGSPEWALVSTDPMGSTVRRLREGRIVVRNTFTYNPDMKTTARQVERISEQHRRSFRARFPMIADVPFEHRWGGHLCFSLNSVPTFGEVEGGIYNAGCCNGLGTVKGTLAGMLIAEYAAGLRTPLIAKMLGMPEPRRLYPDPLMTLGAHLHFWWTHLRAGRER